MSDMGLARARTLLGWSQARLAKEAGEATSTISDIETGRNARPAYVVVMHIYQALQRGGLNGARLEAIFPLDGQPPSDTATEPREVRA